MKPLIALIVETSTLQSWALIEGVTRYTREHERWTLDLCDANLGASLPEWIAGWRGDGVIARLDDVRVADAVRRRRYPAVDLSAAGFISASPCVVPDEGAIAALVSDHFLERGFTRFGFLGVKGDCGSRERQRAFEGRVAKAGFQCESLRFAQSRDVAADDRRIANWLWGVPKPVGILCAYDTLADRVLDVCEDEGLNVPDEVAIATVECDGALCQLTKPTLTSVTLDYSSMGYQAARLLDRLLAGEKVAAGIHRVAPLGIVGRESTGTSPTSPPAPLLERRGGKPLPNPSKLSTDPFRKGEGRDR